MTAKNRGKVDLELHSIPLQHQADETTVCHTPSHEEIRRRAYEIYLERGGLPGDELDDWLRAERELRRSRFSHQTGIVLSSIAAILETEIEIQHAEIMGRRN